MTRTVRAAVPELAGSGRLGLWTGRLAATVGVTGCDAAGAGRTSVAGWVGSTSGATGTSTGSVVGIAGVVSVVGVVGETTVGGAAASELPEVLGTGTSGSEIGTTESFDGSQVEAGA
jgi:hypothetical protein